MLLGRSPRWLPTAQAVSLVGYVVKSAEAHALGLGVGLERAELSADGARVERAEERDIFSCFLGELRGLGSVECVELRLFTHSLTHSRLAARSVLVRY